MKYIYRCSKILPLLLVMLQAAFPRSVEASRPNVLFIAVDDLRPALGCYGDPLVKSPNLDRLASEGSLFARSYCNIPVCGASRASLLGGMRPGFHRYYSYDTWLEKQTPEAVPLNTYFKGNGYTTLSIGKVYHHGQDCKEGWDRMYDSMRESGWRDYVKEDNVRKPKEEKRAEPFEMADVPDSACRDGRLALAAISELENLAQTGEPFFMALGFLKPHLPFNTNSSLRLHYS